MNFPKSTYMYHQKRFEAKNPDEELEKLLLELREKHKHYGCLRLQNELKKLGFTVNKKKIARLIRKLDIRVTAFNKKTKKYNSYKGNIGKVAKNRLRRRFQTMFIFQKIVTDTTEMKYNTINQKGEKVVKKIYLDPFMDLCTREIISYSISKKPNAQSIEKALLEMIEKTKERKYRLTIHTDQGWAYQMKSYQNILKKNKIFQSMSRKGNCLDNSVMENFFSMMKREIYYGYVFETYEQLVEVIEDYIYYYNHHRTKEKLGYLSPVEYRLLLQKNEIGQCG